MGENASPDFFGPYMPALFCEAVTFHMVRRRSGVHRACILHTYAPLTFPTSNRTASPSDEIAEPSIGNCNGSFSGTSFAVSIQEIA